VKPFKRVAIIGTGLIGGSIGLALRKSKLERIGFDRPAVLREALKRKAIDQKAKTLAVAVRSADLILLALPVGDILAVLPHLVRTAPANAVITDAGSTKREICGLAHQLGLKNFVGGHPLAGKEESGVENADGKLFADRNWFLCPNKNSKSLSRMKSFVHLLGAKPVVVEPGEHDRILAATSHLPQLISTILAASVAELLGKETNKIKTFAGSGLKDTTRLAGSPYSVWKDVFATNRSELENALQNFKMRLNSLSNRFTSTEPLEQEFAIGNRFSKGLE